MRVRKSHEVDIMSRGMFSLGLIAVLSGGSVMPAAQTATDTSVVADVPSAYSGPAIGVLVPGARTSTLAPLRRLPNPSTMTSR